MADESLEYKNRIYEIKKQLIRIKELGVDTSKYEELLNDTIKDIEKSVFDANKKDAFKSAFVSQSYLNGLNRFDRLMVLLEEYNSYYKAFNTALYIDLSLKEEIGIDKLNKFVNDIIYSIRSLKSSNHLNFDDEQLVLRKVYDVAYKLIKKEILYSSNSRLLEEIKLNNIDSGFIEELISKDIQASKNNAKLEQKLYELKQNGLSSSLLDEELILLLLNQPNSVIQKEKNDKFTNMSNSIYKNSLDISESFEKGTELANNLSNIEKEIKRQKKDYGKERTKRIVIPLLSFSLSFTGVYATWKACKKSSYGNYCDVKTKTYSTFNDEIVEKNEGKKFTNDMNDKVTVKKYGHWIYDKDHKYGYREVTEYKVSDIISKKDIKDYALLDETTGLIKSYISQENEGYLESSDLPLKNINDEVVVKIKSYENPVKELNKEEWILKSVLLTILELTVLGTFTAIVFPYRLYEDSYDTKMRIKKVIEIYNSLYDELERERIKLKFLLDSNEELKKEYLKFYNKNKFLLSSEKETHNLTMEMLEKNQNIDMSKINIKRRILK